MKRLLVLLMTTLLLVACGNEESQKESQVNRDMTEDEKPKEEPEDTSSEEIQRVTNINLDEFIESFNRMAEDGDFELFERDGNESITADGLLISVNKDGTVWGIVQPVQPTAFTVIATLFSIKKQASEEDAEKIDVFLEGFANAMDKKEELFIDDIKIESMEINVSTINGEVFLFNVLGEEQL